MKKKRRKDATSISEKARDISKRVLKETLGPGEDIPARNVRHLGDPYKLARR